MSYQVLARKWRPQQFGQLVGQDHVKSALIHALNNNRLHHAYLFTGTRGVGKTTIARIFAKSLNCEIGVTATPCGKCSACIEIDKGYFVDLLEIDAASRTKVEDTRDLLDNVQYAPTRGRYKVYLIDEVHMLSRHSFNALLKTLEEPPPHVKFLLATTDPQKLPITVLSRCLQFSLKALSQTQIKDHLRHILGQEHIQADDDALALLARAAKGSLRDSLSLTDQAIAQTNGDIQLGPVREMLGYLEQSWAELLLQDVLNRDVASMQAHLLQLCQAHSHFAHVLDDMLSLLHLSALSQFQLSASELALTESAFVRAVAKQFAPEQIQLYYQLLLTGKKELPYAPDARVGLEMTLLRAIAFVPGAITEAPAQSARAAALAAASVPTDDVVAHSSSASKSPEVVVPPVVAGSQPSAPQQAEQQHDSAQPPASAVEAAPPIATAQPTWQAAGPEQTAAAEPSSEQAIDAVTARILARRGMPAVGAPELVKKTHSTAATAAAVEPARALTPTAINPVLPTELAVAQTQQPAQVAVSGISTPTTAAPNTQLPASTTQLPASTSAPQTATDAPDVPPWLTPEEAQANQLKAAQGAQAALDKARAALSVSQGGSERHNEQAVMAAPADVLPLTDVESTTIDSATASDDVDDEEPTYASASSVAASVNAEDDDDDVVDTSAFDWQWQEPQPQPIRHALLDSLPVQEQQIDFASEEIAEVEQHTEHNLYFDGVISADNFAVRSSAQVDAWAARIDTLRIGGLMRLFLLHSECIEQGDALQLRVAQSQKHLDSERNREQLRQVLSASYGRELSVTVEFVEHTPTSPQAIQERINQARRLYVEQLLQQDPQLTSLCQQFDGYWLPDSLEVH